MDANYVGKSNVKTSDDIFIFKCCITGLAMVSTDELLLVDYQNDCVKILNVSKNTVTSKFKIPGGPWDAAVIDSNIVALTLANKGKIAFIDIENAMSESRSLSVRKNCRGIDHRNVAIAVAFVRPPAVQMLNIEGAILYEVKDMNTFSLTEYIAFRDDGNIVVSDYSKHAVYELTIDGQLKATITNESLRYPRALAVVNNGTVVVCRRGKRSRLVKIVQDSREVFPLSVQAMKEPCSILICEESGRMYVGRSYCNYIKVYDLKK